jgi:FkbM family methyltransferase
LDWAAEKRGLTVHPILPDGCNHETFVALTDLPAKPIIVDVGANVGNVSLRFAHEMPDAAIVAFEPADSTFRELERRTQGNPTIRRFKLGVSDRQQTVSLSRPSNSELARVVSSTSEEAHEQIQTITLDDFLPTQGIHELTILKTDTEGHDLAVLRGAIGFLRTSVRCVLCETGLRKDDTVHTPFEAVYDLLRPMGFRFRSVHDVTYTEGTKAIEFMNSLFVRD